MSGILGWVVDRIINDIFLKFVAWITDLWSKYMRSQAQDAAIKKVDKDIESKSPRTPEVIKDETDFLNS